VPRKPNDPDGVGRLVMIHEPAHEIARKWIRRGTTQTKLFTAGVLIFDTLDRELQDYYLEIADGSEPSEVPENIPKRIDQKVLIDRLQKAVERIEALGKPPIQQ